MIGGMVNLKTGKVTWIPETGADVVDIAFRIDSRLVIINSRDVLNRESPEGPPKWLGEWPEELLFCLERTAFCSDQIGATGSRPA